MKENPPGEGGEAAPLRSASSTFFLEGAGLGASGLKKRTFHPTHLFPAVPVKLGTILHVSQETHLQNKSTFVAAEGSARIPELH